MNRVIDFPNWAADRAAEEPFQHRVKLYLTRAEFCGANPRRASCRPRPMTWRGPTGAAASPPSPPPTARIADGKTSRRIVPALALSVKAVDAHRVNLRRKPNTHLATQLALCTARDRMVVI